MNVGHADAEEHGSTDNSLRSHRQKRATRDRIEAASVTWPPQNPFGVLTHRLVKLEGICSSQQTSAPLLIGATPS